MVSVASLRRSVATLTEEYATEPSAAYRIRLRDLLLRSWYALKAMLQAEAYYGCRVSVDYIQGEPVLILKKKGRVYYR